MVVNVPWVNTTYSEATTAYAGLMSSADKVKLRNIATGATKVIVDLSLSSSSENPVQNKVVYSALAGKAANSHSHAEYSLTGHTHTPNSIGAPGLISTGAVLAGGSDSNFSRSATGGDRRYETGGFVIVKVVGEGSAAVYRASNYTYVRTMNSSEVAADMSLAYMLWGK